jgi:hypothetical protein
MVVFMKKNFSRYAFLILLALTQGAILSAGPKKKNQKRKADALEAPAEPQAKKPAVDTTEAIDLTANDEKQEAALPVPMQEAPVLQRSLCTIATNTNNEIFCVHQNNLECGYHAVWNVMYFLIFGPDTLTHADFDSWLENEKNIIAALRDSKQRPYNNGQTLSTDEIVTLLAGAGFQTQNGENNSPVGIWAEGTSIQKPFYENPALQSAILNGTPYALICNINEEHWIAIIIDKEQYFIADSLDNASVFIEKAEAIIKLATNLKTDNAMLSKQQRKASLTPPAVIINLDEEPALPSALPKAAQLSIPALPESGKRTPSPTKKKNLEFESIEALQDWEINQSQNIVTTHAMHDSQGKKSTPVLSQFGNDCGYHALWNALRLLNNQSLADKEEFIAYLTRAKTVIANQNNQIQRWQSTSNISSWITQEALEAFLNQRRFRLNVEQQTLAALEQILPQDLEDFRPEDLKRKKTNTTDAIQSLEKQTARYAKKGVVQNHGALQSIDSKEIEKILKNEIQQTGLDPAIIKHIFFVEGTSKENIRDAFEQDATFDPNDSLIAASKNLAHKNTPLALIVNTGATSYETSVAHWIAVLFYKENNEIHYTIADSNHDGYRSKGTAEALKAELLKHALPESQHAQAPAAEPGLLGAFLNFMSFGYYPKA